MVNICPGLMFLPDIHKDPFLPIFCFFFYYVNDLFDGFQCNPNLFANDTSLFATVHNINKATSDLINDLTKITKWDFQWKMSLNPGIFKQAQEVIFSCKRSVASRPPLTFNKIRVA